jgi:hypothetical protein
LGATNLLSLPALNVNATNAVRRCDERGPFCDEPVSILGSAKLARAGRRAARGETLEASAECDGLSRRRATR